MSQSFEMNKLGVHLIVDAWGCNTSFLDDEKRIRELTTGAVRVSGAHLINLCVHHFAPHGVTATATLAESHLAIHTWPEHDYLGMDIFFCGEGDPHWAAHYVLLACEATHWHIREIERGVPVNLALLQQRSFAA